MNRMKSEAKNRKEVNGSRKEVTGVFMGAPSEAADDLDLKAFPCKSTNKGLVLTSEMGLEIHGGYRPMALVATEKTSKSRFLENYRREGLNPALVDAIKSASTKRVELSLLECRERAVPRADDYTCRASSEGEKCE